jgi:hypothetical protein
MSMLRTYHATARQSESLGSIRDQYVSSLLAACKAFTFVKLAICTPKMTNWHVFPASQSQIYGAKVM